MVFPFWATWPAIFCTMRQTYIWRFCFLDCLSSHNTPSPLCYNLFFMSFDRLEPQLAPLSGNAYERMVGQTTPSFDERQEVFKTIHPEAEEFVLLTEEGLTPADCLSVKDLVLTHTLEDSVYAGIGGRSLLLSGRLIPPASHNLQRFNTSFYATTRRYWLELGLMGDNNPIKHAKIKTGDSKDHSAFIAFNRNKLNPFQPGEHTPDYQNTSWTPKHGFTTESAVSAIFHVVNLRKLMPTNT